MASILQMTLSTGFSWIKFMIFDKSFTEIGDYVSS